MKFTNQVTMALQGVPYSVYIPNEDQHNSENKKYITTPFSKKLRPVQYAAKKKGGKNMRRGPVYECPNHVLQKR